MNKLYKITLNIKLSESIDHLIMILDNSKNLYFIGPEIQQNSSFMDNDNLKYMSAALANALNADYSEHNLSLTEISRAYYLGNKEYRELLNDGIYSETPETIIEFIQGSEYQDYEDLTEGIIQLLEGEDTKSEDDIEGNFSDNTGDQTSLINLSDDFMQSYQIIMDDLKNHYTDDKKLKDKQSKLTESMIDRILPYISAYLNYSIIQGSILGTWNPSLEEMSMYFLDNDLDFIEYLTENYYNTEMDMDDTEEANIIYKQILTESDIMNALASNGYKKNTSNMNKLTSNYKTMQFSKDGILNYFTSNKKYNPLGLD